MSAFFKRIYALIATLFVTSIILPAAFAAHTSIACPAQTGTVANGGSVEIDITACDPYNIGFGNGTPVILLAPLHGSPILRQDFVPPSTAKSVLIYTHSGNSATSDVFEIEDLDLNRIRFTITISPPTSAIVVSPASVSLRAGLAFSQQLSATGGTAPYAYSIVGGALPTGLSMTSQGLISGTPTIRSGFSFTVRAQDSLGAFTQKTYGGTIDNPIFTVSPSPITLLQGVAASLQLNAGGGTAPYTFPADISVILPPGLSVSTTGLLTGTPTTLGATANARVLVNDSTTDPAQPGVDFFAFVTVPMTVTNALPTVSIAVNPASVSEDGATNLTYTVTRSLNLASPTTVNITTSGTATSGVDYTGGVATVVIPAGTTTATITINPTVDGLVEPDETVTLTVAAGTGYTVGSPASATGTILNDDVPTATISVSPASVAEDGAANIVFTVTLNQAASVATSVNFTVGGTATNGTDYATIASPLVIPAGNTTGTITVNPTADATIELDETVILTLAAGTGYTIGAPNSATGTILNDDLLSLTINDVTLNEGNAGTTNFTFTVSLSAPAGAGGVTFDIATANGSATAAVDYVANSLTGQTIPAGSSTYTFTVQVNGDTLNEPTETFFVNVTNVTGATVADGQGVGTITNDDPLPSLAIDDVTVVEGNSGTANAVFTVSLSAASGQTVTVNYASADGTAIQPADYTAVSGTLTFTPGQTTRTITVPIVGETVPEANETLFVNLSGATNATIADNQGMATISNDDVPVTVNPVSVPGGTVGVAYSQSLSASGGAAPYTFAVTAGALPGGLSLSGGGALTGSPNAVGTFNFTVTATDTSPAPGPFTGNRAYSIVVAQGTQTVTFAPATPVAVGVTPITLTATASSGLTAFTFSTSSANTICTVAGNQLTIVGVGTCALTATQPGNANYAAASANANVVINQGTQTVTFAPASPVNFAAPPVTLTATTTSGLTAFTFTTTSAATICTVAGNQLTIVGVGTCALTATQPGDANYASASASANVVINAVVAGAPTIGTGTPGNMQATIAFTAPTFTGGVNITGYTASCVGGATTLTNTGAASPITVSGLTNGTTYDCSVVANNSAGAGPASAVVAVTPSFRTFSGPSATGTGNITASFTGGGAACSYTTNEFIPLTGHPASPPAGTAPSGFTFPQGLFNFVTSGCTPGASITLTITYPNALPTTAQYWKYGPTPGNPVASWYVMPASISGNTATFTIADGGLGDDDLTANGTIVDQGGPGVPPAAPVPMPGWAWLLLASLVAVGGARRAQHRH